MANAGSPVVMEKSEGRNPKAERNSKSEHRKPNGSSHTHPLAPPHFGFRTSGFFRNSGFGFRNSFLPQPHIHRLAGTKVGRICRGKFRLDHKNELGAVLL